METRILDIETNVAEHSDKFDNITNLLKLL